ncbi:DUF6571 family protein [Streptomyces hebeiensis]
MVSYQELRDLRLGKLDTAVTEWQEMVRKLVTLAEGGDGGVSAADLERKANAADWKGDNATVTKAFTTTTARQFGDMLTEARSVHTILDDAHSALKKHKDDLTAAVDKWARKNVHVNAKGTVVSAVPLGVRDGDSTLTAGTEPPSQEDIDTAAAEIATILEAAAETDRIAARALRTHARSAYDFDETGFTSLQDADRKQGIEDADLAVRLASADHPLPDAELRRFNELAARQRDNPAFAERFATKMGPEGTLQFWRDHIAPGIGGPPTDDREKLLARTRDNLGLTLATASHLDSPAMREWKNGIIAAGDDRFTNPNTTQSFYGYQLTSNLMTKGKWDTGFLNSYGTSLIDFERGHARPGAPQLWNEPSYLIDSSYPSGSPKPAFDPVTGFLEALGHNPGASLEFFNGSSGKGANDGLDTLGNWDYLVDKDNKEARDWPVDADGKTAGYAHLGHALESATLGYPYDTETPGIPPLDTEAQRTARDDRTALMEKVVAHYKTADTIDAQDGIRDSLANMAAGHIDSLNYSAANFGAGGDASGRAERFGAEENRLRDFGSMDTTRFLRRKASEENAYNTVSTAQQVYGASVMTTQGDDLEDAKRVGLHSVKMHGMLDEARFEGIGKEFGDEKEERNRELAKQGEWRNFAAGAVIGTTVGIGAAAIVPTGAAAAIAVPLAFDTVGGAAETYVGNQTLDWLKEREFDNIDESVQGIELARQTGQNNAMTPLLNYAQAHGMSTDDIWDLSSAAEHEYVAGTRRTDTENSRGW